MRVSFPAPGVRVGRPNVPDRSVLFDHLSTALDSGWLSNGGPLSRKLEERVAAVTGARHAVAVCNATVGLELAFAALCPEGGRVVTPSFTFTATIQAARWIGRHVTCVDVDPRTHLAPPGSLDGPDADLRVGVHLWGQVAASERPGPTVYDGAHAFGVDLAGRLGDATVFSFHATKFLNAFEGGAVVTDDAALADAIRARANFGLGLDQVSGTNGKMSEASAAMGLASLDALETMLRRNRENYEAYAEGLGELEGIRLLELDTARNNCQYVVVEVERVDAFLEALAARNVQGRAYFRPCGHQVLGLPDADYPVSAALGTRTAILPTGMQLTPEEVGTVVRCVAQSLEESRGG